MDTTLEEVARRLLIVQMEDLPLALTEVAAEMVQDDADFYAVLGQPVPQTPLAPPVYWDTGHHPTILDWELAKFPNLVTMCYQQRPTIAGGNDQVVDMGNVAYVEAFVWHMDESTVNRIAWRYAKAIHRVVTQNPTLDGLVKPIVGAPDADVSDVSTRRISDLTSEFAYVQGVRVSYQFLFPAPVGVWGIP
jgi:hypothetical protein